MSKSRATSLIIVNAILMCAFYFPFLCADTDILQQAYESYTAGEKADDGIKQRQDFNKALDFYLNAAQDDGLTPTDGYLYDNIGSTFYQLNEYAWALLYYYRAEALLPRNSEVKRHIEITQQRLHVKAEKLTLMDRIFFLDQITSIYERWWLWVSCGAILIFLSSLYLWIHHKILAWAIRLFCVIWMLLLISIIFNQYFAPMNGVMVLTTQMSSSPEGNVGEDEGPIYAGTTVRVIGLEKEGTWLKIMKSDGQLGYVPYETIRII